MCNRISIFIEFDLTTWHVIHGRQMYQIGKPVESAAGYRYSSALRLFVLFFINSVDKDSASSCLVFEIVWL